MRVPPPMPCAIRLSLSTARATSRSRSEADTCASRVWKTNASASRKASTTPCRKRTKNAVYMLIEPEASSSSTRRSGLILRRRHARSSKVPPCDTLRWMVRRRSSRRPRRGRAGGGLPAGDHAGLPHVAAEPERVENLVEAFPVRMGGAEQRAQRRLERGGARARGPGQNRERVARLGQPDLEAVVAQD